MGGLCGKAASQLRLPSDENTWPSQLTEQIAVTKRVRAHVGRPDTVMSSQNASPASRWAPRDLLTRSRWQYTRSECVAGLTVE